MAAHPGLELRVFYLWDHGVKPSHDPGFGQSVSWDIPLLDGYEHEFVPNTAVKPGTHHWRGLRNPDLPARLAAFQPDAVLMLAYLYETPLRLLYTTRKVPLLFRGDSHRLVPRGGWKEILRGGVISALLRRFDACLYVGEANRAYFQRHGVRNLHFAPHAIDFARFAEARGEGNEFRRTHSLPPDRCVFLFPGKFQDKKRPQDLIEAFRGLTGKAALVFAGSGPMEAELRQQASDLPHVHFLPFQNQSQMPALLASCDVMVLPSMGSYETWGLIVNESQALERAVIVSSHVGCGPDLVAAGPDGEPGLIFPAGDVQALRTSMQTLVDDPARRMAMGLAGAKRAERFSHSAATQGVLAAVQSCRR
jgi:glycosyltransferase involved in cell wall biosynthesis